MALIPVGDRLSEKNVEIRGDEAVCEILPYAVPATDDDWATEYLDYKISVKIVEQTAMPPPKNSNPRLMPPQFTSMHQQDSPTAENSVSVQKSEFQPRNFMQEDLWALSIW